MADKPKYQAVADTLREEIADGVFQDGQLLMTEEELKKRFAVSRQTVRQAIALLEDDGLVDRRRGSGTYVKHGPRRHQDTLTVGVVTTYITDYIFPSIVRGIESVLSDNGCIMNLSATYNRVDHERAILQKVMQNPVDGLIVEGTKTALPNPNATFYRQLMERNIPVVFINGYYPLLRGAVHVTMDDFAGGQLAARTLMERGFTRPAGVFKRDDMQGHERYRGFAEAAAAGGLELRDDQVLWFGTEERGEIFREEESRTFLQRLLQDKSADSLVCYNDEVAMALVDAVRELGFRVPRDLAVISFDNSSFAGLMHPRLTTLDHPKDRFGALAAEKLLHMMAGQKEESEELPWTLVQRESL